MSSSSGPSSTNPLGEHLLAVARHEHDAVSTDDSTMFSLDRLMADATPAASSTGGESDEDSGLIDLQALASGAALTASRAQPVPWLGGGEFPLGAPESAPVATVPVAAPASVPAAQSGRVLASVLAVTALLLAAAVVFLWVRGSRGQPSIAAVAPLGSSGALPTVPGPAEPPTPHEAHAVPSVVADRPDPTAATGSAKPTSTPARQTRWPPPKPGAQQRPVAAPAATGAKQAKDKGCDCKPNDLDCHMHCSVKR